jgi:hypothetical protein
MTFGEKVMKDNMEGERKMDEISSVLYSHINIWRLCSAAVLLFLAIVCASRVTNSLISRKQCNERP